MDALKIGIDSPQLVSGLFLNPPAAQACFVFEEAVAAFREALKERTRERVPLQWALTQSNLGFALWRLGERQSGTARLEEAVAAYREALMEQTRERVPLQWVTTQSNLGWAVNPGSGK